MKKLAALFLCLSMLCCAAFAAATEPDTEEAEVISAEIDFDGSYIPFEQENLLIYLPDGWAIFEPEEDVYFSAGDETEGWRLALMVYASEGREMDDILARMQAKDGVTDVRAAYVNGISYVLYRIPEENAFCAATLSADDLSEYHFQFTPANDEEFLELATKILASLSVLDE